MGIRMIGAGVGVFLCVGAGFALKDAFYPQAHAAGVQPPPALGSQVVGGKVRPVDLEVNTPYHATSPKGQPWATGFHTGLDYPAVSGTPVRAAATGTVVKSGMNVDGPAYGIAIVIRHADGIYTQYAHLSKAFVHDGDTVQVGQQIAYSGGTGMKSTAPHLHFEVRTGPNYLDDINPDKWFSQEKS